MVIDFLLMIAYFWAISHFIPKIITKLIILYIVRNCKSFKKSLNLLSCILLALVNHLRNI